MIKINKITNYVVTSALVTSTLSCSKKPYNLMPKHLIPHKIETCVNTLVKKSPKVLNDTTYKYYGKDTLEIKQNKYKTAEELEKFLNKKAQENDKNVAIGTYTAMVPMYMGKNLTLVPQVRTEYAKAHVNHRGIVKSAKFYTTDSTKVYLPVEYYGQINPETIK